MSEPGTQSFWEHLDEMRSALLKIAAVTVICGIVAFLFKDALFSIVLAPKQSGFITYRWLAAAGSIIPGNELDDFHVQLINTGLAEQFIIHMQAALCAGVMCASPYALYQLYRFVSPALYAREREYAVKTIGWGYALFIAGILVSYYLIFPLTFRFLGTYQVAAEVSNMISLQSYMSTLAVMCLAMGIVFEMPVLAWMFARMGFLTPGFMRRYRRHAIVAILIVAAIITPTSDIFTLLLVSGPMWLLYEASILIVSATSDESEAAEADA